VTRSRGRRRKKLLDDLKDRRGYSRLKEEALDRTKWRNRFGGGFGPVVKQNNAWMNEWIPLWIISVFCREFHGKFSRDFVLHPHFFQCLMANYLHISSGYSRWTIWHLSDVLPSINSTFCRATLNPLSWFLSNVSWWKTTRYTKVYYAVLSPSKQY